jgi:histone H3/H4
LNEAEVLADYIHSKEAFVEGKREVLVVASKVKNYIRQKSGMNTSSSVLEVLTNRIETMCDMAIQKAQSDGRKTVMDRDF